MNKNELTESILAEFTPVFKKMTETSPVIATVYSMVNNGTHPATVIESLAYQIIRLQAHLEATETYNGYPMRIQYVKTSPAPRATVDEVNSQEPVRERDTLHICYYCGQMPPVTVFDNKDICGPCSDFLTLNK